MPASAWCAAALLLLPVLAGAQAMTPAMRAGVLPDRITIDGRLDEPAWAAAEAIGGFLQTDPTEGAPASAATVVRVLAGPKAIVIGVVCDEPDPSRIVSFSVRRDASLNNEDHVRIVVGPFLDGRSGYVFAVNPGGARYDGVIEPGGTGDSSDWDGIWEAATAGSDDAWSVEIRIPIETLSFDPGLTEWQFNVQRRIQRLQETSRWAFPARQYEITQMSRAGLLTDLPEFDLGLGLTIRPALAAGVGVPEAGAPADGELQPSLDLTQRLGANVLASLTVNTDFAETEVDTRRTNLTRFPLFFQEKRTFFVEGADIFSFGLGLDEDVVPFFSRRIGLVGGVEVPIMAGGKVNGRIGDTNVGGLVVGTDEKPGVTADKEVMAVGRVKQNIWGESWVGVIATAGDPVGRGGSWLTGADFTYATSSFRGDRNLQAGVWGLVTGRDDLGSDRGAMGFKVAYPNDEWDLFLNYKRIGRDFDPSLGFVPRRAVQIIDLSVENRTRLSSGPIQQLFHEFKPSVTTSLGGKWESYRVFIAPINWRLRSGDRIEVNANPTGEYLADPATIGGVPVAPGSYEWMRYRLELSTAPKRRLYSQITWWFGGFYGGDLDQYELSVTWNPAALVTVEFESERNIGTLPGGRIDQTLVGTRLRINVSPDLSISSYIQYDTVSESLGTNTRLRWTVLPQADLFVVYNHNVQSALDRWQLDSNQLLVKFQYAWRR
jgi:hypothetical protein